MKKYESPQTMTNSKKMEYIHLLLVNGQKKEMAKEIDKWGKTFFEDYIFYLDSLYMRASDQYTYFSEATVNYVRLYVK